MLWLLLGFGLIWVYWLIAYKATHHQRASLTTWFFTIVVIIGILGVGYELLTTGAIGAPPSID